MTAEKEWLDPIPPGEILHEEFMKPLGLSARADRRSINWREISTYRRDESARLSGDAGPSLQTQPSVSASISVYLLKYG